MVVKQNKEIIDIYNKSETLNKSLLNTNEVFLGSKFGEYIKFPNYDLQLVSLSGGGGKTS